MEPSNHNDEITVGALVAALYEAAAEVTDSELVREALVCAAFRNLEREYALGSPPVRERRAA